MNFNHLGLTAVGLSIVLFAMTYELLRQKRWTIRLGFCCIFAVLAIPSILFAAYYLHVFPEEAWFYSIRSYRGVELLGVFLGCFGGAVASLMYRFLLGFPLFAAIVLGLIPYAKPVLGHIPDSAFAERWRGDVSIQSTPSTCGPASVCTILRRLGGAPSERTIARAAFSCTTGTEAWYLARFIRNQGFTARFDFRDTFIPSVGLPAVVGLRLGSLGHFIAVLAVDGDQVTFADPMIGEQRISIAQFRRRYQFTGFHMVISRR